MLTPKQYTLAEVIQRVAEDRSIPKDQTATALALRFVNSDVAGLSDRDLSTAIAQAGNLLQLAFQRSIPVRELISPFFRRGIDALETLRLDNNTLALEAATSLCRNLEEIGGSLHPQTYAEIKAGLERMLKPRHFTDRVDRPRISESLISGGERLRSLAKDVTEGTESKALIEMLVDVQRDIARVIGGIEKLIAERPTVKISENGATTEQQIPESQFSALRDLSGKSRILFLALVSLAKEASGQGVTVDKMLERAKQLSIGHRPQWRGHFRALMETGLVELSQCDGPSKYHVSDFAMQVVEQGIFDLINVDSRPNRKKVRYQLYRRARTFRNY